MAKMEVRVYGAELKLAVLAWVKAHVTCARDLTVSETMVLDGVSRPIGDDTTYATVKFESEKKA